MIGRGEFSHGQLFFSSTVESEEVDVGGCVCVCVCVGIGGEAEVREDFLWGEGEADFGVCVGEEGEGVGWVWGVLCEVELVGLAVGEGKSVVVGACVGVCGCVCGGGGAAAVAEGEGEGGVLML